MAFLPLLLAALAWSAADAPAPLPFPRYGHGSVYADGKLYVIGGQAGPQSTLGTLQAYDPKTDVWTTLTPMPTPRAYFGAAVLGRKIYTVGGTPGGGAIVRVVEAYDLDTGMWESGPNLPQPRWSLTAASLGGKLYALGGSQSIGFGKRFSEDVFVLDSKGEAWSRAPSLPSPRAALSAAALGPRLYVAGGSAHDDYTGDPIRNAVWFDETLSWSPGEKAWRQEAPLPRGISSGGLAAAAGRLVYAGGSAKERHDWDAAYVGGPAKPWSEAAPMPTGRSSLSMTGGDGLVFVTGGSPGHNRVLDALEILDVRKGTWRSSTGRARARAVAAAPRAPPAESPTMLETVPPRPDDYALVIGLEDYRSVMSAQFGERDARSFAHYAKARLGIPAENVILLTGEQATKTDVAKYIEEWLPRNAEKKSRVFVYYSGHGAPDPETGESYLVPWDGDPQFLKSSGYALPRLYENLEKLRAQKVVVFLDACFSGAGGRSVIAKNLRPLVHVLDTAPKAGKVSVLAASAASQVAGGSDERRHGLFTWHLLQALGGEAAHEGHLDLRNLHEYVAARVSKEARRENREQDPQLKTSEPGLRLY
jgi:hypothetical protein